MSGVARSRARVAVRILGALIGLLLLAWVLSVALREENREQLSRLSRAPWRSVALLFALSLLTLLTNGTIFWVVIRPVRGLRYRDVLAVNNIATLLGYLPFKLGLLFRFFAHRTRDNMPVLMIGAWLGAIGVLMLVVLGPIVGATMWRGKVDGLWWGVAMGGAVGCFAAVVCAASLLLRERAWRFVTLAVAGSGGGRALPGRIAVRLGFLDRAHEGLRMLAHPGSAAGATGLRALDIGAQAARFIVVAGIVGTPITAEQAILAASTYFIIGVITPAGQLGFREAGVSGVLALLRSDSFALIVLAVTAADMVVTLVGALVGSAWLRATRTRRPATTQMV